MSVGQRVLETRVEKSAAVLQEAPAHWSYSALKEVETCALRFSLATANYPALWGGYGYPRPAQVSALFGNIVHDALELIVRALVAAGCTTSSSPDAVVVLRALGGYSAVVISALKRRIAALESNPRVCATRRGQIQRQLEDRVPEARTAVQSRLSRMTLTPRLSRAEINETRTAVAGHSRHALSPGTYTEVALLADELRAKGRLDILTITGDFADITDHKTGLEDPAHLDQLRFYGELWTHDLVANPRRTPLRKLTLAYPNRDVSIDVSDDSDASDFSESIKARVLEADKRIEVDQPDATTGPHCSHCSVRSVCAVYWTTMIAVPSSVAPQAWFDFEGIVGAQNGANSWWMLDLSGTRPVLLLRTTSAIASLSRGQRVRLVGIRRDADPETEAVVATLTTGSEVFVVVDDRTD